MTGRCGQRQAAAHYGRILLHQLHVHDGRLHREGQGYQQLRHRFRQYTSTLPLFVISRPFLTDCSLMPGRRERHGLHHLLLGQPAGDRISWGGEGCGYDGGRVAGLVLRVRWGCKCATNV